MIYTLSCCCLWVLASILELAIPTSIYWRNYDDFHRILSNQYIAAGVFGLFQVSPDQVSSSFEQDIKSVAIHVQRDITGDRETGMRRQSRNGVDIPLWNEKICHKENRFTTTL